MYLSEHAIDVILTQGIVYEYVNLSVLGGQVVLFIPTLVCYNYTLKIIICFAIVI